MLRSCRLTHFFTVRRKEFNLRPLYEKRRAAVKQIPGFWRNVFLNAPEEISANYSSGDVAALAAIEDFYVTRPDITSETQGDPRSLKFEFTFADNEHFSACTLVKEFVWKPSETGDGPGSLVSKAVPIQWKGKKGDLSKGMLDMAVELEKAEEAMKLKKGGEEIELVEREGLWQYEKLREAIEKSEEAEDDEPTWLNWFGFRGRVEKRSEEKKEEENGEDEEELVDEFDSGLLDVEIFPSGEDVAIALAEDLYPDAMDFFSMPLGPQTDFQTLTSAVQSQEDDDDQFDGFEEGSDDDEMDDDEAPELVDEANGADEKRPSKRQRTQ
jgi:hypothetical protein